MSLTRATLRNRHAVWAGAIAVALLGSYAYFQLPMQLFPDTAPPLVNVLTTWPGAAAKDVAAELSEPLEDELAAIVGIRKVRSISQDNLSLVTLEFQYTVDSAAAAIDVQNAIARMGNRLPAGIGTPQVLTFSTADRPIITVGVRHDELVRARRLAEDVIAPRLMRVPGVAAVDVFGGAVPAVLVDADPRALEARGLSLERLAAAIKRSNASAPSGRVRSDSQQLMMRIDERASTAEALREIPLGSPDGARLTVGDVAHAERGTLDDDAIFAIGGERAIAVQIFKTDDANTVDVVRRVQEVVAELQADQPGFTVVPGEESASFTEQSVDNLLDNVWQALLLAALIIFLFLGKVRASAVAIVSMPLSYAATFGLMFAFGIELNMVTLSAVILAVGMVVDASVVVLENIVRVREEEGKVGEDAAAGGTDEMVKPVLAGVATTLIVLVPLLSLGGFIGRVFQPLALTLILAFSSSVVVALLMVPTLSLHTEGYARLDRVGELVAAPFQWLMARLRDGYVGVLRVALRFKKLSVLLALATFVLGVAGMRLAGMEVLPKMDGGSFFVSLETPSGTSVEETARVVHEVEQILLVEPEVTLVQSQAGFEPGMRSVGGGGVLGPTQGFITVTLTPRTERDESIWSIEERVRERVARVPGMKSVVVRELGNTAKSTTAAPIVVRLSGEDPLVLDRLGDEVLARVATVPNVIEPTRSWARDQERVRISVDGQRAAALGLTPTDIATKLAAGSEGIPAGDIITVEGRHEPVRVRFDRRERTSPDALLDWPLFLPSGSGAVVPARQVASASVSTDQGLFTREDLSSTLDVTAFVDGRPLSFVVSDVERALAGLVVPSGVAVDVVGENSDLAESTGSLARALILSIIAVYLLLVAQFRSFVHPITVMLAVPLSIAGVAAALHLTGKPVSMPVMVGLVLLVGTVVNSSIILVDFISRARAAGVERNQALLDSVKTRFRPVMMTSLSTIVGMFPLAAEWALGAERFSPLAVGTVGGMITATFLTLIFIPVAYDLFEDIGDALRPRKRSAAVATLGIVGLSVALLGGAPALAEPVAAPPGAPAVLRLDLEQAQALAIEHSPRLRARRAEVDAADSRKSALIGRFLPRTGVQLRYTRVSEVDAPEIELPITLPNGETPEPVELGEVVENQYSARVTVEQPLFAGGALVNGWRAAGFAGEVVRANAAGERADAALRAAEAYFGLAAARELASVANGSAATLATHVARLEVLYAAGRATELELERARARHADADSQRLEADLGARDAELSLRALLGLTSPGAIELTEPLEIAPTGASIAPAYSDHDASVRERALAGRPELAAARAGVSLRRAQAGVSFGALFPRAAARVGYQFENPNQRYFPVEDDWQHSWDASLVLSWDWDWTSAWHEHQASARDAAAAALNLEALEEGTAIEVTNLLRQRDGAELRVQARLRVVQTAQAALSAAEQLFEAGRTTSFEVLTEEAELARARAELVRARVDARVARERLERLAPALEPQGRPSPTTHRVNPINP